MENNLFYGVCTALVTPFVDNAINYPLLEQLLQRQMDCGINAIVLSGTTGESPTLSDKEKLSLFSFAKNFVGSQCTIIAGTGSNDTKHAVELSKSAQSVGVDSLLIVTPYYNKATPSGLVAHYESIANAVDIPLIVYNVPSRTGVDVPVSVYAQLASNENIIGVKEASADITKITKIRQNCGDTFSIWSGNDDQIVPVMALGGKGVISVLSNILPAEAVALTDAALSQDYKTASRLQCQLQPLIELLFCEVNPIPVKAAMKIIGYDCGPCRLPLTEMSSPNYARLKSYLT